MKGFLLFMVALFLAANTANAQEEFTPKSYLDTVYFQDYMYFDVYLSGMEDSSGNALPPQALADSLGFVEPGVTLKDLIYQDRRYLDSIDADKGQVIRGYSYGDTYIHLTTSLDDVLLIISKKRGRERIHMLLFIDSKGVKIDIKRKATNGTYYTLKWSARGIEHYASWKEWPDKEHLKEVAQYLPSGFLETQEKYSREEREDRMQELEKVGLFELF